MKGNYLRKLAMLIAANLVIKPVWILFFEITIQNRVGLEDYGRYAAIFYLSLIFQILLDVGVQTHNIRKVVENPRRLSYLLPGTLTAKLFLGLIYLAILLGVGWYAGYEPYWLGLLGLLGVAQLACSLSIYMRSMVTALQQYGKDIFLSVLDRLLMIALCSWLLFWPSGPEFTLERFVWIQVAAYFLSALVSFVMLMHASKISKFRMQRPRHILSVMRQGLPFAVLILLMSVFMRGDLVVLERLVQDTLPEDAGRYKQAERLLDAANNFSGVLLASWLLPLFARYSGKKEKIVQIVGLVCRLVLPLSLVVVVFGFFFGEEVMEFCYSAYQKGDGRLLFYFLCAFPFYCLTYIFSTLNTALRLLRPLIGFALLACVVNLTANVMLVAHYGVWATALIAVCTQLIFSLGNFSAAARKFSLEIPRGMAFRFLILVVGVSVLVGAMSAIGIDFRLAIIFTAVAAMLGMFYLGFLKASEWNILQNEV